MWHIRGGFPGCAISDFPRTFRTFSEFRKTSCQISVSEEFPTFIIFSDLIFRRKWHALIKDKVKTYKSDLSETTFSEYIALFVEGGKSYGFVLRFVREHVRIVCQQLYSHIVWLKKVHYFLDVGNTSCQINIMYILKLRI